MSRRDATFIRYFGPGTERVFLMALGCDSLQHVCSLDVTAAPHGGKVYWTGKLEDKPHIWRAWPGWIHDKPKPKLPTNEIEARLYNAYYDDLHNWRL
jgi:hypothetical protein